MYPESDLAPISALQHLIYCERQCALIHIEQVWAENRFTAEGRLMHARVHSQGLEKRGGVRIGFAMALRSLRLGLTGKADVVEFHLVEDQGKRVWRPFPIEYKRGRPKKDNCDRLQLCAQGLCLEEMLGVHVPGGALFYGKTRRRQDVCFDQALRAETEEAAKRLHRLLESGQTPKPLYSEKCGACSLAGWCMPKTCSKTGSVGKYLARAVEDI
ncbi:MAG: CRISPR-associated protein Cas4 [Thermodesulfobacteriota bacterium]|nr:CRISPR-associated protein Cas4 [Thermodesulfobacteriota bacterium]